MKKIAVSLTFGLAAAAALSAQPSIQTAGSIETAEQLVSTATVTSPLAVSSTTLVSDLNADLLDGNHSTDFGLASEVSALMDQISALEDQLNALGVARVPRTGQATCYDAGGLEVPCGEGIGVAQDGALQLGVVWPDPRFTGNGDGTVTDNLTGLIWLADASCFEQKNWTEALGSANGLFDGSSNDPLMGDCDLEDNSQEGEWRLPNVRELQSLVHYGLVSPAVPDTAGTGKCDGGTACAFSGVVSSFYWSSSTYAFFTNFAWTVSMTFGNVTSDFKTDPRYVWPVRGGQ